MTAPLLKPEVVDSQGRPILLGSALGKGGEGTVYEVRQTAATVAKVYHKLLSQDRTEKIRAMVGIRTDVLGKLTAWPIDLLITKGTGRAIGLIMPRIANRMNVHHLYGPKCRLQDFPRADWRFLVHAAANIARAFAVVHEHNRVIGDVNHGSIMVAEDATVCLIDCDSFQINTTTRRFLCEVGIETFTPPELQGLPFKGVVRTPNCDNFGLAVMIFQLLFMGRHPFAGRYTGAGEMPIAKAIKEFRFPYSSDHRAKQMDRPPGTPPLVFVGLEIAHFFEIAFSQVAMNGSRPTARDWVVALQKLEKDTKQCANNRAHWHPLYVSECPWCQMEAQGANPLFPFIMPDAASKRTLDVDALWRQLKDLDNLGQAPGIPLPLVSPSPAALKLGRPKRFAQPISLIAALAIFFGGCLLVPALFWVFGVAAVAAYQALLNRLTNSEKVERLKKELSNAEIAFNGANRDWHHRAGDGEFRIPMKKFDNIRTELSQIPAKRLRALDQLKQRHRELQLNHFLDKFEIEDAKINGIGPERKRTLESHGIETAKDIVADQINRVPGFGPVMISRLTSWRRSVEAKFVFDPAKVIDPRDIAKVEQDILTLRVKIEAAAKSAHAEARQAHARILAARQAMRPQMEALNTAVAQARVDYKFVKG